MPHACAPPYHQGSGSHGQLFRPFGAYKHGVAVDSSHMCCVELALRRVLCTRLSSKGLLQTTLSVRMSDGYAMLMSSNKGETAVHGYMVGSQPVTAKIGLLICGLVNNQISFTLLIFVRRLFLLIKSILLKTLRLQNSRFFSQNCFGVA